MLKPRSSSRSPIAFLRRTIMSIGLRHLLVTLLVAAIGVPGIASAQGKPSPSGDPVPAPAPGPKPEPPPDGSPPTGEPAPDTPPGEVVQVSGRERLAWNQAAPSNEGLAALRYVAYVDGEPRDLSEVSCASESAPEGFECSSPLPSMGAGQHTLEVTAYIDSDGVRLESFRSPPVFVQLGGSTSDRSSAQASAVASADPCAGCAVAPIGDARFEAAEIMAGLDDPTDITSLPDGRLLVTERRGRIRVVRGGTLADRPAAELPDVLTGDGRGLLSIAADRAFEETGHVYVLFSTPSGLALGRFTANGDALVDRAVLLDGLPISQANPAATIRMGPDGKLYVGLDSRGDVESAGDLGSYSGKVLRLNTDGTTPADQPGHSPVFGAGLDHPAGLAWSGDSSTLWIAGRDGRSRERLDAMPTDRPGRLSGALRFALPAGTGPSAIVLYDHTANPVLEGSLLVGASHANGLLRIWFDAAGTVAGTEWLLQEELGSVRALAVGSDGALYAVNANVLLRVTAR